MVSRALGSIRVIDLDQACEILMRGMLRASVFSSMGYRLADRATPDDLRVSEEVAVRITVEPEPTNLLESARSDFRAWAMNNGLRELVESFGLLLKVFCDVAAAVVYGQSNKKARKLAIDTEKKGELKRLQHLTSEFGIKSSLAGELESLIAARNCITHRWGIPYDAPLTIRWVRPEFSAVDASGTRRAITLPLKENLARPPDGQLSFEWKSASKTFRVGEPLRLTPAELHEMCLTVHHSSIEFREKLVELSKRHQGIFVKNTNPPTMDLIATYASEASDGTPTSTA